jgi:threonine aldolase
VVARTVQGESGVLRLEQLDGLIRPANDHLVRTRLVALENTHNRGGGRIQPFEELTRICRWARQQGLRTHLDGARLLNAAIATGISAQRWAEPFDTVSICFSKGLGAPVGSALAGSAETIRRARRARKLFGGGMRQAGIIAAGALYALEHHVERLAEDHEKAQLLAAAIREADGLTLMHEPVETNIVIFQVDARRGSAQQWVAALQEKGVAMLAVSPQAVRAVTHLDVTLQECRHAAQAIGEI